MTYHHGSLRETMLAAAARAVAEGGIADLSLRALAREAGVSHTAPRHHFGDKRGLITALATEGYERLTAALSAAGGDFLESGVQYVGFALANPGHFAVMHRPEIVDETDEGLRAARKAARVALTTGAAGHAEATGRGPADNDDEVLPPYALLAWGAAHGIATLALAGALGRMGAGGTPEEVKESARRALRMLAPT